MKTLGRQSIDELGQMLRTRVLSCQALTQAVLQDIETRNPYLGAFTRLTSERALKEAEQAQYELDKGIDRGPLHGIPYAIKELFNVAGQVNSAGTPLLDDHRAQTDAAVVSRLADAGAVLVGQTHTSPLAATILGINHARGTPHNPWQEDPHIPGGSSSGAAVAVAAGLIPFAIATDTGGSIRVPAALCGVVGLKPTVGKIDTKGMWPLAPSLDAIGPLTRSVQDALSVYAVLQGAPVNSRHSIEGLRIGVCETVFFDDIQTEVETAVYEAARVLQALGAKVFTVTLPEIESLYKLTSEISFIAAEAYPLHKEIVDHSDSDWVLHWLRVAAEYSPEQVAQARKKQTEVTAQLNSRIESLDALLVPTTPFAAPLVSSCDTVESHAAMSALLSRNTYIGNLAGWCGLSVPCGFNDKGLPIGLMVYAGAHNETMATQIAQAFTTASTAATNIVTPPYSLSETN